MARWFRSEPMEYISMIVKEDASHDCLNDIGRLGVMQFTDLNPEKTPFQRRYVSYVKRCDELERKLRFFGVECEKLHLKIEPAGNVQMFFSSESEESGSRLIERLENDIERYENQLKELNRYSEKLTEEYNRKQELHEALGKARIFFSVDSPRLNASEVTYVRYTDDDFQKEKERGGQGDVSSVNDLRFSSLIGVVSASETSRFERMIFRSTRGNCFLRFAPTNEPMKDPLTGEILDKTVFVVFYKSDSIEKKLKKICDAFTVNRYSLPDIDDTDALEAMMTENFQELLDSRTILKKNKDARFRLCQTLAKSTEKWTWMVLREKSIYHSLNMFKADVKGMLRGEGWVLASHLEEIKVVVGLAHTNNDLGNSSLVESLPKPWPTPPTHFTLNKFTSAYQEFVNTYGIPRYREANPAIFTAVTFPFLFGVMFGDIGHGLFLLAGGIYLLWNEQANEKTKLGEMAAGLHTGRYMITMMGFFAIYAGFMYNEMFALGLNLFQTRYYFAGQNKGVVEPETIASPIADYGDPKTVYPIGLDPIWQVSSNELSFCNSFKMKLSVIIGIIQMFAGTCLKGLNDYHFGEKYNLLLEFLPMVCFALSLFVYMVILIFMKWFINWNSRMLSATCLDMNGKEWGSSLYDGEWKKCDLSVKDSNGKCTPWGHSCTPHDDTSTKCPLEYGGTGDGCQPPNLITTMINILLSPGEVNEPMYNGQSTTQNVLLAIAVICVPILLFAKPYFLSRNRTSATHEHRDEERDDEGEGKEEGIGEILIHQAIETIEFVLGMVSNTASYLRLWALSLAHSQLAIVLWEKAMLTTLKINLVATFFGFGLFAGATLGILLLMDVLECFLHALRLHWVEFQNKFYKADGILFSPYCFKRIIEENAAKS